MKTSKALALAIEEQEKIKEEIHIVKSDMKGVESRVTKLESENESSPYISTASDWLEQHQRQFSHEEERDLVSWCEKLSMQEGEPIVKCPSRKRYQAKFSLFIIEQAYLTIKKPT